jgi:hypothetical protein
LSAGEGDGVFVRTVQLLAVLVEVLIEVFGFVGRVDEDIGFGDGCASEVVGTESCAVVLCRPVAW